MVGDGLLVLVETSLLVHDALVRSLQLDDKLILLLL